MENVCSMENVEKLIDNVVASFQMDHIEVPPQVIIQFKNMLKLQVESDRFCKKLTKGEGNRCDQ